MQPFLSICLLSIGFLFSPFSFESWAQTNDIKFTNYNTKEGLSHYPIRALLQDNQGFLWIGTQNGLNRFDGYQFLQYFHDSTSAESLSSNFILALHEDRHNNLWIGTNATSIDMYNRRTNDFKRVSLCSITTKQSPEPLPVSSNVSIVDDQSGQLWFGSSNGLMRLKNVDSNKSKWTCQLIYDTPIHDLLVDEIGYVWVAFEDGLLGRINPSQGLLKKPTYVVEALYTNKENPVTRLAHNASGHVIASTARGSILKFSAPDNFEVLVNERETQDVIKSLAVDEFGTVWFGTQTKGLHKYDISSRRHASYFPDPSKDNALIHHNVTAIEEDNNGNIWIGTWGGLSRLGRNTFFFTTVIPHEFDNRMAGSGGVLTITELEPKNFLLGTDGGGIVRFKEAGFMMDRPIVATPSFYSNIVPTMALLNNELWVGTLGQGVLTYEIVQQSNDVIRFAREKPYTFSHNWITKVLINSSRRIWIGTTKAGLNKHIPKSDSFVTYRHQRTNEHTLSSDYIATIFEDKAGITWIGTANGGLNRFDERLDNFRQVSIKFANESESEHSTIFAINQTQTGTLWLGLKDNGLIKIDTSGKVLENYNIQSGLPDHTIVSIGIDKYKTLWLGTNNGLSHFNPKTKQFTNYSEEDGIHGQVFYANSSLRASDGRMLFGGANGLTIFDPAKIRRNEMPAPIVLVDFKIKGKPADDEIAPPMIDEIELEYDQNFFTFTFASLDFTDPDRLQYRYKLENYDDDWIERTDETRRFANYTGVKHGEYKLRVQATNSSGVWNRAGLEIPITIHPPFWKRAWFRLLSGLAIAGILFAGHRYRLTKQQQIHNTRVKGMKDMEQLRMRIAGQLHDRVSANLSTIGLMAESMAFQNTEDQKEKERFDKITRLARDSANSIRETSWVVNTGFDRLDKLVSAMEDVAQDMLEDALELNFESSTFIPDTPITMDFRQNVYYFLREALHNIIKHAGASSVTVTVSSKGDRFELCIDDDGRGFDPDAVHESNGMVLFRRRARDLKGTVSINTSPGKGTSICLTAPIAKPDFGTE